VFCPNCGTQNDDSNAKCQKCGFNIKGAVAPKFKGTMLMMNAPPGAAQRLPSPVGTGPAAKTVPVPAAPTMPKKNLAKATMIGVAPPSPGAVAPPVGKPEVKAGMPAQPSVSPTKPAVTSGRPGAVPGPAPAVRPGPSGSPPVNPFGGTMLMGAVPDVQLPPAPAAAPVEAPARTGGPGEADAGASGAGAAPAPATAAFPMPSQDTAAALSATTPSVAPPPPTSAERLPSDMPTVASAIAPAIEGVSTTGDTARAPQPNWVPPAAPATGSDPSESPSPESWALAQRPAKPPAYLVWVLAVLTLGVYPLVTWLRRKATTKTGLG